MRAHGSPGEHSRRMLARRAEKRSAFRHCSGRLGSTEWASPFPPTNACGSAAAQTDIAAAEAFRPIDLVDGAVRPVARGDPEHPPAIGQQPVAVLPRAGVEDLCLGLARRRGEAADLAAALRI